MDAGELIHKVLPLPPPGNPDAIRSAAQAWRNLADGVERHTDRLTAQVSTVGGSWNGAGHDAFAAEYGQLDAAVQNAIEQLREVGSSFDHLAGQIEEAQHRYRRVMAAVAGTVVLSIGLTVFTCGFSDAVGAEIVAVELSEAVGFAETAVVVARVALSRVWAATLQTGRQFVVNFGVDLGVQMVNGVVSYPDHNPFRHLDFASALVGAGGATALGAMGPALLRMPGVRLLPPTRAELGLEAIGGMGSSAFSQYVSQGRVDNPVEVLFSGAAGLGVGRVHQHHEIRTVELNGYEYTVRGERVLEVRGEIHLTPGDRVSAAAAQHVRDLGLPSDEAGRLIAPRFDGPADAVNLIPKDSIRNHSAWSSLQNSWQRSVDSGHQVQVQISPIYGLGSRLRPTDFLVRYTVDDESFTKLISNAAP